MKTHDVFISYNSEEYREASTIRSILSANGISCWMAPESIPFGSNYAREIPSAIADCKVFLLILSKKSQSSRWVALELDRAMNESKLIYPLQIEDCDIVDPFNFMLSQTQRYNAYTEKMNAMKRLVQSLRQILGLPAEDAAMPGEQPAAGVEENAPGESVPAAGAPEVTAEEPRKAPGSGDNVIAGSTKTPDKTEKPVQGSDSSKTRPDSLTSRVDSGKSEPLSDPDLTVSRDDSKRTFSLISFEEPEPTSEKEKETEKPATVPPQAASPTAAPPIERSARTENIRTEIPDAVNTDAFMIQNNLLIRYTGQDKTVVIPEGVRRIGEDAFKESPVEQVICPDSLRHIGRNAFRKCPNLNSLTLNEGLKNIGDSAFFDCRKLTEIKFPGTLQHIGMFSFKGTALTDIVIPASVKMISGNAFAVCFELLSVDLACEEIGDCAFDGDYYIREILLRESVKRVGKKAFACSSKANVNIMNRDIVIEKKAFHKKAKINYVDR